MIRIFRLLSVLGMLSLAAGMQAHAVMGMAMAAENAMTHSEMMQDCEACPPGMRDDAAVCDIICAPPLADLASPVVPSLRVPITSTAHPVAIVRPGLSVAAVARPPRSTFIA